MKSRLCMSATVIGLTAGLAAPGASAQTCDRACLEGWVDRYFDAVIDDDPSAVPLADDVRFTENGQRLRIGDGLWRSMKDKGGYRLFVTDPTAGQVALLTTIVEDDRDPAGGVPALMALRLKIENGRIAEIEQFVARNSAEEQPDDQRRDRIRCISRRFPWTSA